MARAYDALIIIDTPERNHTDIWKSGFSNVAFLPGNQKISALLLLLLINEILTNLLAEWNSGQKNLKGVKK